MSYSATGHCDELSRNARCEIVRSAKPYTNYRPLLRAFIGVYKCASALRGATIPSNKVARNSAP